jgi:vacuolar protein sorting-associated protein 41
VLNVSLVYFVLFAIPIDPILSKKVYGNALQCMFTNAVQMRASADTDDKTERLIAEAESHFLNTLLQWGTTQVLNEHVRLYKYLVDVDSTFSATLESLEDSLRRRFEQTAAVYLSFPARNVVEHSSGEFHGNPAHNDSLYDVDAMMEFLEAEEKVKTSDFDLGPDRRYSRVALDAKAELSMMMGQVDRALRYYLTRGVLHSSRSFEGIEHDAVAAVHTGFQGKKSKEKHPYAFVLSLIENKHLFQCLLDESFLSREAGTLPLIALIRLVGLELAGGFLMEHCVAPQKETKIAEASGQTRSSDRTGGERRGTLPLDLVAAQLEASPKLLYWYLHLVFVHNPDLYVRFPNTANPPPIITALHRKALDLYINYAGEHRDSVRALMGVEPYRVSEVTTPLLSFLKVVLQLGGISPTSVGKMLQIERKGGVFSRVFALELAYIMEHYGEETEDDARLILDVYLKGTQSMMLTVSYVQRALEHRAGLWEILIQHCLTEGGKSSTPDSTIDGTLFGSLLEAAGLCGADLAKLVEQIPPGMSIVGLRPRLVAAVADYRMKLQTHQSASQVAATEKIELLRELAHRSRRGMRYEPSDQVRPPAWATFKEAAAKVAASISKDVMETAAEFESPPKLSRSLRPKQRQDRHYLSYSLQIR